MKRESRGFIKHVTGFTIVVCILFIVVAAAAKYVPAGITGSNGGQGGISYVDQTPDYGARSNPLLGFLDTIGTGYRGGEGASYTSASSGSIVLDQGNASYSSQPFEEHVVIENRGNTSVDITGWTLMNGKGSRPIQNSQNDYFYPTADSAMIGQGTQFLDPSGKFIVGDIVLKPGDRAIVVTGGPFANFPYSINTSFRENICVGYLKNYPFDPPLDRTCPYIDSDPDIRLMTDECYDYMRSLPNCTDPSVSDKRRYDEQTSVCRNYMATRLNYPSCVARNQNSADFSKNQWRVFLGKKLELWASSHESITLYDRTGNVVDRVSY
ncbi:MAG TPA: hypothetical protein VIR98_02540 [Candidatus Paceibacterota bacterium]|jgi:hypothetical protein